MNFQTQRYGLIVGLALLTGTLALPSSAFAHERRTILNGKYDVVVGWDAEPAYYGQKNAASIRISQTGSNPAVPVEGADKTLKIQIRQGATTKEFPLRAMFGQPGYYVTDLVPTRTGDYVFVFTGTINQDAVNETFDSADGKFDSVRPANDIAYPAALPDPVQAGATVEAARAEAQSARTLAYAGIAIGVLGLLAGVAAWATRPRAMASKTNTRPAGRQV